MVNITNIFIEPCPIVRGGSVKINVEFTCEREIGLGKWVVKGGTRGILGFVKKELGARDHSGYITGSNNETYTKTIPSDTPTGQFKLTLILYEGNQPMASKEVDVEII